MKPSQQAFLKLHQQGYERATKGDPAGANECYERALALMEDGVDYPTATAVRANLAQNYAALGDLQRAWTHAKPALQDVRAIEHEPTRGHVMNQLAWFLYEHGTAGQLPEALALADGALEHVPDTIQLATMDTKMRILIKLGRQDEARSVARAALRKDPDHPDFQDVRQRWLLDRPDVEAPPPVGRLTPIPY